MARYLGRTIQTGSHDSIQDAIAAMELAKLILKYGTDFTTRSPATIFTKLKQNNVSLIMVDKPSVLKNYLPNGIASECTEDLLSTLPTVLDSDARFIYSQIHDLSSLYYTLRNSNSL